MMEHVLGILLTFLVNGMILIAVCNGQTSRMHVNATQLEVLSSHILDVLSLMRNHVMKESGSAP